MDAKDDARFAETVTLYEAGKYREAAENLEYLIEHYPNYMNFSINLAACYEKMGDKQAAIDILRRGVELAPTHLLLHHSLSRILYFTGGVEAVNHTYSEGKFDLVVLDYVQSLTDWQEKDYLPALKAIQRAYSVVPESLEICKAFCGIHEDTRTTDFNKLFAAAQVILAQEPENPLAHRILAMIYHSNDVYDKAIEEYTLLNRLSPVKNWYLPVINELRKKQASTL